MEYYVDIAVLWFRSFCKLFWATLIISFYVSVCLRPPSAHLSDHKKTSPDIVPVRRPTWGQYGGVNPIRCLHFRAKRFRAKHFRANLQACPNIINWVLAPGRTSDVRQQQCQEKFFMVRRSVGRRGVGQQRALSDGGQRTDISFYFFFEPPNHFWHSRFFLILALSFRARSQTHINNINKFLS